MRGQILNKFDSSFTCTMGTNQPATGRLVGTSLAMSNFLIPYIVKIGTSYNL